MSCDNCSVGHAVCWPSLKDISAFLLLVWPRGRVRRGLGGGGWGHGEHDHVAKMQHKVSTRFAFVRNESPGPKGERLSNSSYAPDFEVSMNNMLTEAEKSQTLLSRVGSLLGSLW